MRYRFRVWDKEYKECFPLAIQQVGVAFKFPDLYIIEQCTGTQDVESKYIYQGDIIKDELGEVGVIFWDEAFAGFAIDFENYFVSLFDVTDVNIEVIGNRFENPELITW